MKRTALKRRKRLAPKSDKQLSYDEELAAIKPFILERAEYRCEYGAGTVWACHHPLDHVHHRLMRSHGGTNDPDNLLGLCFLHHHLIHAYPRNSYKKGFLIRSGGS